MANALTLQEFIDVDLFVKEINEDISDLNEAMRTITARAGYYAIQAVYAKKQASKIDINVKAVEASLRSEHRKKLTEAAQALAEDEGGKPERITAEMVESAVYTDGRMMKLLNIQLEADEIKGVCAAAVDAFRTRRDMLKSMGHLAVEGMRGPMRMHAQQASSSTDEYRKRRAQRESQTDA